jgi:hypothetical protein
MLVVCTEGHEPVCWDPSQTDICWMCGRSIRVAPPNARYSEMRGDKDLLAAPQPKKGVRRRARSVKSAAQPG